MSPESIQKEARILCLTADDDDANDPLTKGSLPFGSKLLMSGVTSDAFDQDVSISMYCFAEVICMFMPTQFAP
jgi:hypothetical protein